MNLVFCGTGWLPAVDAIRERLPEGASIRIRDPRRSLIHELRDAHVILPSNARIDAGAIQAARALRLIQQPAAGYEGIDLEAARARGVPVCNAPGANSNAVAEAAVLLMLALARRLRTAERAFAAARIGEPMGTELSGKTVGIIGYGRIGARVASIAAALGMEVVSVRSTSTRAELDDLLACADYISLHCPLTSATQGLIDAHALLQTKAGAFLVNCARGPIVDRDALEHALDSGKLGGVGLDTFWAEPWDPGDPFFARDNVVTLPHIGGSTREAFGRIADIVTENVARLLRGQELLHRVA